MAAFCSLQVRASDLDFKDFDSYQGQISYKEAQKYLTKYLVKTASVYQYITLTEESLTIYATPEDQKLGRAEYILKLKNGDAITPRPLVRKILDPDKKLQGKRIALDPGHLGGDMRFIEERYVHMKPSDKIGGRDDVAFDEGTLTLGTALILKRLLESAGATVMMTKTQVGESAYHKSFADWKRDDFEVEAKKKVEALPEEKRAEALKWWMNTTDAEKFSKLYNAHDLTARAEKINEFKPDLTLMIHYNAIPQDRVDGHNVGTDENFNMAFIPGSFVGGELKVREARYHFLRLLLTGTLEKSEKLSKFAMEAFAKELGVTSEIKDPKASAPYLEQYCLKTDSDGVYCRNLGLTRQTKGVICYGETLCQINFEESLRLAEKDITEAGIKLPKRIEAVARAYYNAILAYAHSD